MVNAVELKKHQPILNRLTLKYNLIGVLFSLLPLLILGQENDNYEKRWEEINNGIEYNKPSRPKGPNKDYIAPQSFAEDRLKSESNTSRPNDEQVIYSREKRYDNGENQGVKKHIRKGEGQNLEDLLSPDVDAPKSQRSIQNRNFGDGTAFKYIFIFIAIVLVVFLLYYFFFNRPVKSDKKIETFDYERVEDINPEMIPKSQLEIDLEKAILDENYRAGLRIYYILLLKALMNKNLIKWAKRKTNTHYLAEMTTQKEFESFNKAVNMYEWTWYGKNNPSKEVFERFAVFYDDFLKRLKDE